MMNKQKFCQSCGMPMAEPEHFGTNTDGTKNEDYCCYCYQNGAFTGEMTMEEMIEFCLNCEGAEEFYQNKEQGRRDMQLWFPTLKRWKKENPSPTHYKLCTVPEFTVTGKLGQGSAAEGPQWVLPLWAEANGSFDEIAPLVCTKPDGSLRGMWGVMGHPDRFLARWDEQGLYLAGCETKKADVAPTDWTQWTVPEQTYLVLDCSQSEYGDYFGYTIAEYLPKHGLTMVGAAHEHYPEPGNPMKVELFFPISSGQLTCSACGKPLQSMEDLARTADGEPSFTRCCYCGTEK